MNAEALLIQARTSWTFHIVRVRAKLKKIGAPGEIKNRWGEGWYMTPGDKAKFNAWIDQQWSGR